MLKELVIPALRGTGNTDDAKLVDALAARIGKRGDFTLSGPVSVVTVDELLDQAVRELKEKPHNPKIVTLYWQALWQFWVEKAKADLFFMIPPCDRTTGEITKLEKEGRKLVYVPDELANQESRHLLGQIFPEIQNYSVKKGNSVTNKSNQGGWFDIEASPNSPNLSTTEKDLADRFKELGKVGQSLNVYLVGSKDEKFRTGHYFDEKTGSRLPGSRRGGRVVNARFGVDGSLRVRWEMDPRISDSFWGGRSEGAKKA